MYVIINLYGRYYQRVFISSVVVSNDYYVWSECFIYLIWLKWLYHC